MLRSNSNKYPLEIKAGVKRALIEERMGELSSTELDGQIETMAKVEVMDKYLHSYREEIRSSEICRIIKQIFGLDLDSKAVLSKEKLEFTDVTAPLGRVVIDLYLNRYKKNVTGADIRKMINEIFGVNLDAISSLEKARISLYSKDQWIVHHDRDLFVVHTGAGDVDAWVYPTEYLIEQTGLTELPDNLQHSLTGLGYSYNEKIGSYYYANPSDEAVPDAFKGKTIGAIVKVIQQSYAHL